MGHGTSPVPHRGCIYNSDNFYTKLVIAESDSPYVKAKKQLEQARQLGVDESGLSLTQRLILQRTPIEVQNYNEFIKHSTDNTFDSSGRSGINPTKVLKGMSIKK